MQEQKIIQRFIAQKCIGHQHAKGVISVIESRVLFTDGQEGTIWRAFSIDDGYLPPVLFDCPRVDVPSES